MSTTLVPADKTAASVVTVLENAKTWLATAVEMTGPEEIAAAKAHIRTAETYARELHLSKDIQQDAQEMVRRAEYALGRSIRKGQEAGTIETLAEARRRAVLTREVGAGRADQSALDTSIKPKATDYATHGELYKSSGDGIMDLAAAPEHVIDAALDEAKAEGNLSRANVVRKVKQQAGPTTRDQRAELIEDLAQQGYSSRQMPSKVGVSEESVRQIARDYGITIPADRSVSKTRRIDSTNVVVNTATALEGLVSGVELIDFDALDIAEVRQWATSLTDSMRTLNRFVKQIREVTQ